MSWAKMGKSAIAPPKKNGYHIKSNSPSTVLLLKTNFIPSVKLCITGSDFLIHNCFLSICDKASNAKNRTDKTVHY
jgi:hypothetical protein